MMRAVFDLARRAVAFIPRPLPHGGDSMQAAHIDSMHSRLLTVAPRAALDELSKCGFGNLGGSWRSPAYFMEGVSATREIVAAEGKPARQTISVKVDGVRKVEISGKDLFPTSLSPEQAADVPEAAWEALGSCLRRALTVGVGR